MAFIFLLSLLFSHSHRNSKSLLLERLESVNVINYNNFEPGAQNYIKLATIILITKMKKMKKSLPIAGILMLLVSLTSCHRETNCECTTTLTTGEEFVTYTDGVKGQKGKCWQYESTDYDSSTGEEQAVTECVKL